mgnify:CR=1 FL=1
MTGCRLWLLGTLRQHTELCWLSENQNKLNPKQCYYPLITYLNFDKFDDRILDKPAFFYGTCQNLHREGFGQCYMMIVEFLISQIIFTAIRKEL